jgi:hypothetical protein
VSCPSDDLLNEYFIFSIDILVGHITDLFNRVFDAGYFPEIWSKGFIKPLHKKGDHTYVNNYRGITLLSNFGKLFISILTNRVEKWFDDNNILSDAQFGFRKGCSTVDAIFMLHNLINQMLSQKCDYLLKKAFDSVNRNALWYKLFNIGLDGKLLRSFNQCIQLLSRVLNIAIHFQSFSIYRLGCVKGKIIRPPCLHYF